MSTKAEPQALLEKLYQGDSLSRDEANVLVSQIIQGEMNQEAIAGMLIAMKIRGETIDEISGAVDALRNAAKEFPTPSDDTVQQGIVDIVGTGGDGHNTINISTTAAFVAAAAGAKVAKHGNRSVSSKSGSSDLLAQFGINLTMTPETARDCLDKLGLCFLFAPHYHGGVHHVIPVRQALKTRTLFNVLGPLINPSRPDFIVLGVYSLELVEPIAQVLKALGMKRAMVVHGSGLDEVALHGDTYVCELNLGEISQYTLNPEMLGVPRADLKELEGGLPEQNAEFTRAILQGQGQRAHTHAVAINAGCALYISGVCDTIQAGTKLALATLASGKAFTLLEQLADASVNQEKTRSISVSNLTPSDLSNKESNKSPNDSPNILTKIVDTKAAHIAALKLRFPEESLQPKISDRSLFEALKGPNAGFIFECKKASPSKGLIRPDFDVEAIADVYNHYAAGISVLTDEQFFQGDMDYIPRVRARVSQPILCKDFFVDTYQVLLAAHQGADAILLMLSVLDDTQYRVLASEAARYQLDILTEVSNEAELKRAIALDANIIGINNRNLRDLSTDLATTEALAPQIPADTVVISESGIYNQSQIRRLSPLVDGFLVGSSLMAADDLDLACRTLIYGHNKVCGLTRSEDIAAVAKAGAIYAGLIFYPKSPRAVDAIQALTLVKTHRALCPQLKFVGVFVNESPDAIAALAKSLQLFAVQLHSSESEHEIDQVHAALKRLDCNCEIWKAVAIDAQQDSVADLVIPTNVSRVLFDSKVSNSTGKQFGGTGKTFNWQLALPNKHAAMLAGGLTPELALQAANQGFLGLDFNSGLERAPGIKDSTKISAAFNALRHY